MTLVSSVWREVTQKLGLLKALIGFCTIAGEESKRKAEPRTRSASRLSLAEMKRFELLRRGTPDLPHFEFYRRLLITWFLLSISVSLVRPQTRMKSGLFEKIARKY